MLQGLWTDAHLAFTVGLDQRVHCWHLKLQHPNSSNSGKRMLPANPGAKTNLHETNPSWDSRNIDSKQEQHDMYWVDAEHCCSSITQVLEPAALDVCMFDRRTYYVLVAGRGTELLSLAESE